MNRGAPSMHSLVATILLACGTGIMPVSHAQRRAEPVAARPPMGWNSYDCFSYAVNEAEVKANAGFMAARLKRFGWQYVVVDYVWSCPRLQPGSAPNQDPNFNPRLNMDAN